MSRYEVECGAHGCSTVATFRDPAHARAEGWHLDKRGGYGWICAEGWHLDKRGGYGWICPKCQEGGPLPENMEG